MNSQVYGLCPDRKKTTQLCSTWQDGERGGGVQSSTLCYSTSPTWKESRGKMRLNLQELTHQGCNIFRKDWQQLTTDERSVRAWMFTTVNERPTDKNDPAQPLFKCKHVVAWLLLNLTPLRSPVPPKTTALAYNSEKTVRIHHLSQIYFRTMTSEQCASIPPSDMTCWIC